MFASWQYELTPVAWPTDDASANTMTDAGPNHFFQDEAGDWFVRPPLAQPEPGPDGVVVLSFDGAGIAVVTASEVTHDRESALRLLPDGDDPAISGLRQLATERLPSGRRDGISQRTGKPWRKSHDKAVIARALVVEGWKRLGYRNGSAIRAWLRWEHELGGEYGNPYAYDSLKDGHEAFWRDYVREITTTNRRVLNELRANLRPKTDPARPDDAGHGPVRPPGPQPVPRSR